MKYVTTYAFKPFMTKEQIAHLLALFAEVGNAPGAQAHYVRTDGGGGTVVGETDDIAGLYRNQLAYTEFCEFDTKIVLPVEEAVPMVMEHVG